MASNNQMLTAQAEGRHVPMGFPHFSSNSGLCMCLSACCHGKGGCICKGCMCQMANKAHGMHVLPLTSGNTISSHGMDGTKNGLHNHHPSGGRKCNG